MKSLRELRGDDRGTTLVEFALVVPVIILLLISCLDFMRAANAYVILANASRDGARYASAQPQQLADGSPRPVPYALFVTYVQERIAPLEVSALTITPPSYARTSDERWSTTSPSPWTVTVNVRYDWHAVTWLVGQFFGAASGSGTFDVSSTMVTIQ
jgi:Flp pilus assembly protein TadG